MASTVDAQAPSRPIGGGPTRSVAAASWTALGALMLRDLVVLRKHIWEFALRTIIQPFLLCFVFLYVFPKIGQGIGGHGPARQSAFATILVPSVLYLLLHTGLAGLKGLGLVSWGSMNSFTLSAAGPTPRR